MTEKQTKTRRKIIEALIDEGGASAARLCAAAEVSRVTALKEINSLLSQDILVKSGVNYGFYGCLASVILKVDKSGGEILGYVFGGGVVSRVHFDFSDMLSYEENVRGAAKQADEYSDFLKRKYKKVICCFIYSGAGKYSYPLPALFSLSCCKEELLASAVLEVYGKGLCISCEQEALYVCNDGRYVRSIPCGDMLSSVENILDVLSPDMILLDGDGDISELCREIKTKIHRLDVSGLRIYEREMLIRALLK